MAAQNYVIESVRVEDLRPELMEGCCDLWSIAFAKPGRNKNSVMTERRTDINESDEIKKQFSCEEVWHIIWESDTSRVLAAARSFRRIMSFADGCKRPVFGLAHVASHPDARGAGLGKKVVQEGLNRINSVHFQQDIILNDSKCEEESFFLFQSSSPEFYTKLGARILSNDEYQFINSTGMGSDAKRKAGFWDESVLVFPEHILIPVGEVDLLGPGY